MIWSTPADPSVYSFIDWDVTDTPKQLRQAILIKAVSEVIAKNKTLNSIIRSGKFYSRSNIDVSIMVNIPNGEHDDLTFTTLRNVNQLKIEDINKEIYSKKNTILSGKTDEVKFALKLVYYMPKFLGHIFLKLYGWLENDLGINLKFLMLPNKPFGPVIISNIGSLGLKKALLPLVPFTRSPVMVSMGSPEKSPKYLNNILCPREIICLGITFDHRYFDGSHAARMFKDFENALQDIQR